MSRSDERLGEWLDGALTNAPQELAVRIRTALPAGWRDANLEQGSTILKDAAASELRILLGRGCETRRAAAGLLTVDALVTYACELLALSGAEIEQGSIAILDAIGGVLSGMESAA
ncbi:MAG: hypothetical protein ABI311_05895 [Gemmatimonadaceae bacterium]